MESFTTFLSLHTGVLLINYNDHIVNNTKKGGTCFTEEMPEFFDSCRSLFYGWAIGGTVRFKKISISLFCDHLKSSEILKIIVVQSSFKNILSYN